MNKVVWIGATILLVVLWGWNMSFDHGEPEAVSMCVMFLTFSYTFFILGCVLYYIKANMNNISVFIRLLFCNQNQ